MVTGIIAQGFISNRLIALNDAAATANNILAHHTLFQAGFTIYLIEMACQIITTALFYFLLKPVSKTVALVAAFLGLAGCTIKTLGRVFYLAPTLILTGAAYAKVFSPEQLRAFALLFLQVNDRCAALALAFFGFYALLNGYLIFQSRFLPRFLGAWSMLAGLGWLTFLYPSLGYRLFPYLATVGFLGAMALIVWFLVFGVIERRWAEQTNVHA